MVERLLCKQDVRSSNLLGSTKIPVQRGFFVGACRAMDACSSRIHASMFGLAHNVTSSGLEIDPRPTRVVLDVRRLVDAG